MPTSVYTKDEIDSLFEAVNDRLDALGVVPSPPPPAPPPPPPPDPDPPAPEPSSNRLVTKTNMSIFDPEVKRLFGPGIFIMDMLSNLRCGDRYEYSNAIRFRSPKTGNIASIKAYWVAGGPGYAGGTGGVIRIRVYPDNGSLKPNQAVPPIATGQYVPKLVNGKHVTSKWYDTVQLTSVTPLLAGNIYHVVFDNVDADPVANYISVNHTETLVENGKPSRWISGDDWGSLYAWKGSDWNEVTNKPYNGGIFAPILQVNLADGSNFGNTDMETGNVEGEYWTITSTAPARERITPRSKKIVTGISFMTAASVAGSLKWELKDGSSLLAVGTVSEATANFRKIGTTGVFKWYDIELPTDIILSVGKTYDLLFTPQSGSQWIFADERNGSDYGFTWPSSPTETQAQHYRNGRWLNAYHWNHDQSSAGSNWRVVLHTA